MSILIGVTEFSEPVAHIELIEDRAGLFAIFSRSGEDYELLELGEAERLRTCLCGSWFAGDTVVAVHYTSNLDSHKRKALIRKLEREFEFDLAA